MASRNRRKTRRASSCDSKLVDSIQNGDQYMDETNFTNLDMETDLAVEDTVEAEASKYFAAPSKRTKRDKKKKQPRKIPLLSMEYLQQCFEEENQLEKDMKKKHTKSLDTWMLYLSEGINLLLSGFGSKLELLEEFRKQQLVDNGYTHIVVHGYRPDANIKHVLAVLESNFMKKGQISKTSTIVQRAQEIRDVLNGENSNPPDFVLIIHSIDGVALRDEQQQEALSYLAEIHRCHMVATMDHVNAALLWDRTKSNRFRWFWVQATTYAAYRTEILDGHGSKILGIRKNATGNANEHTLNGLKSIWASLNSKSREVFIKLCKRQLNGPKWKRRPVNLMSFWELLDECRQHFLASNETALQQILTEYFDHRILETTRNDENEEVLRVTVDRDLLIEFLLSENVEIDEAEVQMEVDNEVKANGIDGDLTMVSDDAEDSGSNCEYDEDDDEDEVEL